jgi:HD-GYP domain-containing protein (c-di-GMP phosphodiesterase class II)
MSECVVINVDSLIIGRTLPCPIRDRAGILLLAKGELLTADRKRQMLARDTKEAVVPKDLAPQISLFGGTPSEVEKYERELNQFVDEAIRTGRFNFNNSGPAVAESVVDHGCKRYSPDHVDAAQERLECGGLLLDGLLADVVRIGKAEADSLRELTKSWTQLLANDIGGSLYTAMAYQNENGLVSHAMKMATLGMAIAIDMELDAKNVAIVGISGLLADIGMAQIPKELREADHRLSACEFARIQRHVIYTANYVERIPEIPDLARVVVYQVHERPNGTGYPRRRTDNMIHLFAKILNVADAYVAMTTARPFRRPMMPYAAMKQLLKMGLRRDVDKDVLRSILDVLSLFPIGSYVTLTDGSVAQVMRSNAKDYMSPLVARIQNAEGEPVSHDDEELLLDLSDSDLSIMQALPRPGSEELNVEGDDAELISDLYYAERSH